MKYIVYRTTCLINNKIYVGVHHTDDPNIFDGYLGRGLWKNHTRYIKNPIAPFHYAVRKYGVENFKREVLFIYPYNKEAREKLGLKLCSISQAIKLGRQCNGFRWTKTDNPTPTI